MNSAMDFMGGLLGVWKYSLFVLRLQSVLTAAMLFQSVKLHQYN